MRYREAWIAVVAQCSSCVTSNRALATGVGIHGSIRRTGDRGRSRVFERYRERTGGSVSVAIVGRQGYRLGGIVARQQCRRSRALRYRGIWIAVVAQSGRRVATYRALATGVCIYRSIRRAGDRRRRRVFQGYREGTGGCIAVAVVGCQGHRLGGIVAG